ncbi:MAG TPA: bifunctional oligoribonuclease/PAP phosphatase NrnA [Firmicutes bacterium]|nr:bifunctional oligoribonuclease/PAP phosphatase NrnA [Bacillota bacterium]
MSEPISAAAAADRLRGADRIVLLTHQYPDGDTLGCGFALCRALQKLGKTVRVECPDEIPEKYGYLSEGVPCPAFEPAFVCAVDVADARLLGPLEGVYAGRIALCIDHHGSNTGYARELVLRADYAAAAMVVREVIAALGVEPDRGIAECLYTGIATDTGCFKYSNTTAQTLRMAAEMLDFGVNNEMINRTMFDVKTRARVELERQALDSMRFYLEGRCAVMLVTNAMIARSGAGENDLEGLAPIPRQIEGVWVGVTMREKKDGSFKVSVRTGNHADASAICTRLGGGGHLRAAGCTLAGPAERAVEAVLDVVRRTLSAPSAGGR